MKSRAAASRQQPHTSRSRREEKRRAPELGQVAWISWKNPPSRLLKRRRERNSVAAFRHAPIVVRTPDDEGHAELSFDEQRRRRTKMRRFLRAIGFSCFSRRKERRDTSAALRAITIEDARYTFQQNLLDDDVSTVYSSHYDGNDYLSIQQRQQLQFVLFGGTEHSSSFQPEQIGPRDITVGPIRLSDIRADMNDRQLPVFFTPSPPDSFAKDGFINLGDLSRLQATAH